MFIADNSFIMFYRPTVCFFLFFIHVYISVCLSYISAFIGE